MIFYILDTNILYTLAEAFPKQSELHPTSTMSAEDIVLHNTMRFFLGNQHKLIIPDLVWTEFQGGFLHKGIDMEKPEMWFRNRTTIVQQIESIIASNPDKYQIWRPEDHEIYEDASRITQSHQFLDICLNNPRFSRKLRQAYEWTIEEPHRAGAKIFDGMDSAIVGYAIDIAAHHQEVDQKGKTQKGICVLCSGDNFLHQAFGILRKQKILDIDVPDNLLSLAYVFKHRPDTVILESKFLKFEQILSNHIENKCWQILNK